MASNTKSDAVDVSGLLDQAVSQFRGLDPKQPGQWPWMPKVAVFVGVVVAVVAVGWFALLSSAVDELQAERDLEPGLKQQFESKLAQAVNLGELRKQKLQVQEYVTQLEKQLPGKAEMDALLSDINQAGLGRGLMFDLFKPGQVEVKDFYAELPITLKVSGRYHDIGSFAADVANLSRIVTLHNLGIGPLPKDTSGLLSMEGTARTYRYLDAVEVEEQRKAAAAKAASAKGAAGAKK